MGLDTTHDCWHGPYSSFNKFRYRLAEQIGINLDDYAGYKGAGKKDLSTIDHGIMPLLNHSDCDGVLTVAECASIVTGLESILEKLPEPTEPLDDFKENIEQFIKGCKDAIGKNEIVEFH